MPKARQALVVSLLFSTAALEAQQQLGNKMMGTIGLRAGSQPDSGLYVLERFVSYSSNKLVDASGHRLPLSLDLDVIANVVGIGATFKVPWISGYMNASIGVPAARVTLRTDRLEAGIDRFGLGDLYVQPIKLGWKMSHSDVVFGYAFYAPTASTAPGGRGGVGLGHWTHEFQLGGTLDLNNAKTWQISALASYALNRRKHNIDITRGDTVQIQGGIGKTLFRILDVGLAAYALWQVRDDRGADLPQPLRGGRDRAYGLGPEILVALARIRSRVTLRYEHDISVNARPLGQILVIGLAFQAVR